MPFTNFMVLSSVVTTYLFYIYFGLNQIGYIFQIFQRSSIAQVSPLFAMADASLFAFAQCQIMEVAYCANRIHFQMRINQLHHILPTSPNERNDVGR